MRLYISGSVRKIASTVMPSVSEASLPGDPSFYSGLQASCLSLRSGRRLMRRSLAIARDDKKEGRDDKKEGSECQSDSLFYLSWNECEASHKKALQFFV